MTMESETYPPPWSELRVQLDGYEPGAFREGLRAVLEDPGVVTAGTLRERVLALTGAWVGEAVVRAVCGELFLAEFPGEGRALPSGPGFVIPRDRAEEGGAAQAATTFGRLRALADAFDAVDGREGSVERAVDRVLDAVMGETGVDDDWYFELVEPVAWLCDHLGRPRGPAMEALESCSPLVFATEGAPSAAGRLYAVRALADAMTGAGRALPADLLERAGRILRPERARLAEALAAVAGATPQGALEALVTRGLLDARWLDEGERSLASSGRVKGATPPGRSATESGLLALLASDASNVLRAEMLAREVIARLGPFGLDPRPWRVVWVLGSPGDAASDERWSFEGLLGQVIQNGLWTTPAGLTGEESVEALTGQKVFPPTVDVAAAIERRALRDSEILAALQCQPDLYVRERASLFTLWAAAEGWSELREADARFATWLGGARARDLPAPLDALVALWDTGYALRELDEKRRVAVLLAPDASP